VLLLVLAGLANLGCKQTERDLELLFDSTIPIDGTSFPIKEIGNFAYDGDNAVFAGKLTSGQGLVTHVSAAKSATAIARNGDDAPAGEQQPAGTYVDLEYAYPDIDNDMVAFTGTLYGFDEFFEGNWDGVFASLAGPLLRVVDSRVSVPPSGSAYDFLLDATRISTSRLVFDAPFVEGLPSAAGNLVVQVANGNATTVADTTEQMPGRGDLFGNMYAPQIDGTKIVFYAYTADGEASGLYLSESDTTLSKLVESTDVAPGGTVAAAFSGGFAFYSVVGDRVYFTGFSNDGRVGLYSIPTIGGTITLHVDTQDESPEGDRFQSFEAVGPIQGTDDVVFTGISQAGRGVYRTRNGNLETVLAPGDLLNGKTVTACTVSVDSIRGTKALVRVSFSNASPSALYIADLTKSTEAKVQSPIQAATKMVTKTVTTTVSKSPLGKVLGR